MTRARGRSIALQPTWPSGSSSHTRSRPPAIDFAVFADTRRGASAACQQNVSPSVVNAHASPCPATSTSAFAAGIGAIGTVYVTLPASRVAGGQINVTVSGRLETLAALNAALRAIPSGEKVKVVGVIDTNTVLVEPLA